jgi:hypothetical protein
MGCQFPDWLKVGSSSEVDGFRLQVRDGLLVERGSPVQAFQLFDLKCLGLSIGRADADEDRNLMQLGLNGERPASSISLFRIPRVAPLRARRPLFDLGWRDCNNGGE